MGWNDALLAHYPEARAGGFSRVDGSIQFLFRVQSLLAPGQAVLEFGAGRGHHMLEDHVPARHALRCLSGDGRYVVGVDVDPIVMSNPFLDEAHVIRPEDPLPFPDGRFDIIFSDHVFEHVSDPAHVAAELARVTKPGGWICARTPNKWSYAGIGTRLIPNRLHARVLQLLQPGRKEMDVFPTVYRLNTGSALRRFFPCERFADASYTWDAEPVYVGTGSPAWALIRLVHALTPRPWRGVRFIFLQKRC
jgi:SAM-dependent methyltransferase